MANEFILPDLGEGLTEATIVDWRVAVGDEVTIDQLVVEVESAKSVVELPVPYEGVVLALGGAVGQTLHAGDVLLTVGAAGERAEDAGSGAGVGAAGAASAAGGGAAAGPGQDAGAGGAADEPASGDRIEPAATEPAGGDRIEPAAHADGTAVNMNSGAVLVGYGTRDDESRPRTGTGRFRGRAARRAAAAADTAAADTVGTAAGGAPAQGTGAVTAPAVAAPDAAPPASATGADILADHLDETRNSPVMSPLVRREARAAGFDARHLEGSGPGGLVLRDDVRAVIAKLQDAAATAAGSATVAATASSAATAAVAGPVAPVLSGATASSGIPAAGTESSRRVPLTGLGAAMATHMAASHVNIPKATIWLDADVTPLLDLRARLQQTTGEKFSITTLVARLVVAGLRRYPALNSSFDGDAVVHHAHVNLGLAAQTPRGLVVPVIHGVQGMNLRELRDAVGEVVEMTRAGKFPPERLRGGTFTLNNYGGLGVDGASPIINQPEVAMLGIGRIVERPWAVDGAVALRRVATFSFVFDHRVCDGETAAGFLTFVTTRIERPELILTDL